MSTCHVRLSNYTILIVSFRDADALRTCLLSIRQHASDASAVLVWDNVSENSSSIQSLVGEFPEVQWTFSDENVGFAAAVNVLAGTYPDEDFLLLNPDAVLVESPTALREAVTTAEAAAAGPAFPPRPGARPWDNARPLANPFNAALERAGLGRLVRIPGLRSRYARQRADVGYLSGACLYVSRLAWTDVGAFDERYWLYSEEMDWARRARGSGWRLRQVHERIVEHTSGGTVANDQALTAESRRRLDSSVELYLRRHFGRSGLMAFHCLYGLLASAASVSRTLRRRR